MISPIDQTRMQAMEQLTNALIALRRIQALECLLEIDHNTKNKKSFKIKVSEDEIAFDNFGDLKQVVDEAANALFLKHVRESMEALKDELHRMNLARRAEIRSLLQTCNL